MLFTAEASKVFKEKYILVTLLPASTYSKQRRRKSKNSVSQFFKTELMSLEFGRRFLPLEFVMQRGLPLESEVVKKIRINFKIHNLSEPHNH